MPSHDVPLMTPIAIVLTPVFQPCSRKAAAAGPSAAIVAEHLAASLGARLIEHLAHRQ